MLTALEALADGEAEAEAVAVAEAASPPTPLSPDPPEAAVGAEETSGVGVPGVKLFTVTPARAEAAEISLRI